MKIRGNTVGTNIKPERVLEKAGVTPELAEQVATNSENINNLTNDYSALMNDVYIVLTPMVNANTESIGKIETALDAILAIQNELIGGDAV